VLYLDIFDKKEHNFLNKIAGFKHGRVPKVLREQQILDIAEQQFIELGYEITTVESVRLAAGVSRPMIYEYYGSKDRLFLACVKRVREEYEARLSKIWESNDAPLDLIERAAYLYFSIIKENPKRWLVLFNSTSAGMLGDLGQELRALSKKTINLMINLIESNFDNSDHERIEAFSHAIFAVGEHLGQWWVNNPEIPMERVISHHVAFITQGLSGLGEFKEFS